MCTCVQEQVSFLSKIALTYLEKLPKEAEGEAYFEHSEEWMGQPIIKMPFTAKYYKGFSDEEVISNELLLETRTMVKPLYCPFCGVKIG